jgi:hypothetical protein
VIVSIYVEDETGAEWRSDLVPATHSVEIAGSKGTQVPIGKTRAPRCPPFQKRRRSRCWSVASTS